MRIRKLEWNDPIRPVYEIAKAQIEQRLLDEFEAAYSRYVQKLSHLSFIWDRLRADVDAHEKCLELAFAGHKQRVAGEAFTSEELAALGQLEDASKTLYLDYEDFFIHSKILMDRTIFLTQFFLPRAETKPSTTSFTRHRQFFQKPENIPFNKDEEYARYMRENTQWFETMLKAYRDSFVVHDVRFRSMGVISGPAEPPRLFRVRGQTAGASEWQHTWSWLMSLREKYLRKIPGLDDVTVNAYELIDFLDSHASMIEPTDLKTLAAVRVSTGGKLPDVLELANHIKGYLCFYGQHFYGRITRQE
jgi:hypothetical protein